MIPFRISFNSYAEGSTANFEKMIDFFFLADIGNLKFSNHFFSYFIQLRFLQLRLTDYEQKKSCFKIFKDLVHFRFAFIIPLFNDS